MASTPQGNHPLITYTSAQTHPSPNALHSQIHTQPLQAHTISKTRQRRARTSPAITIQLRNSSQTLRTITSLQPCPHPSPSLQRHFYLLSLPLLAVFLPIGLTETKAKKGINDTSLTNFNISPRFALWR